MARKSRKHIAEPIFTSVSPFINTALYIRLSVEDNKKRGNSIETQKMVLKDYLSNKPELTARPELILTVRDFSVCSLTLKPEKSTV